MLTSRTRAWLMALAAGLAFLYVPLKGTAQAPAGQSQSSGVSDLSAAQRTRAQARGLQFQKDAAALQSDKTLTDAQKRTRYAALAQTADNDTLAILTPPQRALLLKQRAAQKQIAAQFQKDVTALQADKSLTDAQRSTRYDALRRAATDKAMATLTPAQRARVAKQQQTAEEATRMGKELQASLTPAQDKQIHAIGLAAGTQVQTVFADKSMAPSLKTAKIKGLELKAQAKINAILTPAQRAKYARLQQMVAVPPSQ